MLLLLLARRLVSPALKALTVLPVLELPAGEVYGIEAVPFTTMLVGAVVVLPAGVVIVLPPLIVTVSVVGMGYV